MALAVASTSTASTNNANNVVVTKPTGVAVGDLLLIASWGSASCTGFVNASPSPFFYDAPGGIPDVTVRLLYRIADSSDVSASNYTIEQNGAGDTDDSGSAAMLRITGWTSGNPLFTSASVSSYQDATSFTLTSGTLALKRPSDCILLMISVFRATNSPYSSATFSGYSVTSGVANPSWTEVIDANVSVDSGPNVSLSVAYATTTSTSDITEFTVVGATDTGGTEDAETAVLCVLASPINLTTDLSHINVAPTIHAPTVTQVHAAPDISHNAVVPTVNGIETRAIAPTQWQNEDKPSTAWINDSL